METTIKTDNFEFRLSDDDIINPDEISYQGDSYATNLFVLHDHGFTICAVWARNLQDAIDHAVDADKLDRYLIDPSDYADYGVETDNPTCAFLGNASEPFDIDTLGYVEIAPPRRSNCAEIAIGATVLSYHV